MAVFSTKQNRQFYLAKNVISGSSAISNVGDLKLGVTANANNPEIFFTYKGADTAMKSDLIPVKNVTYAKIVSAADMATALKKVKVALKSDVNSGNPIAGQDYVLRMVCRQFYGMSDEDQYIKDAVVHATSAMAADKKLFYKAMVAALNLAFSREIGATAAANPYFTFGAGTSGSEDGIYITEKPQDWKRGITAQERVYFDVLPTLVYTGTEDVIWGDVTDQTPAKSAIVVGTNAIGNGTKIADLEWFCAGEKGDQYREVGFPNYIPTEYLVDPTKQYDVLEIHFAFTDTGVNSYRSEKDITIAVDSTDATGALEAIAAFFVENGVAVEGYDGSGSGD